MPSVLMPLPVLPHPEEVAQRPSRRTHRRYAAAAALGAGLLGFLLAACDDLDIGFGGGAAHSAAGDWIKPGAQPGESASAYSDCRSIAQQATRKDADIDQDIAATRGADLQRSQIVQMRASQQRGATTQSADSIVASCMQQKGFVAR